MALPSTVVKFYYHHLDLSPYLDGVEPTFSRDLAEHRPLGGNPVRLSAGHKKLAISLSGVYDAAEGGEAETVWAAFNGGEVRPFAHLPEGDGLGKIAYCGLSDLQSEQITAGEGFVKFPVAVVGSQQVDRCRVLLPLGEQTAGGNGQSLDHGAATSGGAAGYLLCTAITGTPTLEVRIQHSSNGADWADLIVFDELTARGSAVAYAAGTVNAYTRAIWNLSGGNATFFVALGRR